MVSQRVIDAGHSIKYHNSYYQSCLEYPGGLIPRFLLKGIKALVIKEEVCILKEVEQRKAHSKECNPEPTPVHKEKKPYKQQISIMNSKLSQAVTA
ncbi:MAG: hypothetical protein JEY71_11265 [Sphaerochaeta sp.]|nr:hypothetical protein [Sphaerochaeta sp.]